MNIIFTNNYIQVTKVNVLIFVTNKEMTQMEQIDKHMVINSLIHVAMQYE